MRIVEIKHDYGNSHAYCDTEKAYTRIPDGWAVIPDDMETPNFPFGEVEVEEVIHYRDVQVMRDVVKTREVEQLREVTNTREVLAVDDDGNPVLDENGNPVMTTEEYTDFETYTVTEEYTEQEMVTEQEPYGVMTVTKWIAGELPGPDLEALAVEIRAERDKLLTETDWTQVLDAPISAECREAFRVYRQALRDITEQEGFPENVIWPVKPEVVKATPDPVDTALEILVGGEV